ncbi:MAG TPA: hypothetical protein VHM66_04840 [Solirubrobacterales bacterium]|nr:hypothetical protein [Solirubrobacterales bacterium]
MVTIAAVGDTAMGITPTPPPEPASYFDPIEGELKGAVVFGNLEGTLTDGSETPKRDEKLTNASPSGRRRNTQSTSPRPASR